MTEFEVMAVVHQTFQLALKIALPFLVGSMLIGIVIAIFQAATQINEQTMTFVPKLLVVFLLFGLLGSTVMGTLKEFTVHIFSMMMR